MNQNRYYKSVYNSTKLLTINKFFKKVENTIFVFVFLVFV